MIKIRDTFVIINKNFVTWVKYTLLLELLTKLISIDPLKSFFFSRYLTSRFLVHLQNVKLSIKSNRH